MSKNQKSQKKEISKEVKKDVKMEMKKKSKGPKAPPPNSSYTTEHIKHIKLGLSVTGLASFSTVDYSLNAGNESLYPRLAQIATTFQYWRFRKWSVHYEPIASVFGNAQAGQVCLSLLENWYDAPPDSLTAQTERARACKTTSAWLPMTLQMPPTRWLTVRDSPGSQGQDMRLDDVVIEVGREGFIAGAVGQPIGNLFLTAEVEFKVPYSVSIQWPPRTNRIQCWANSTDVAYLSSPGGATANITFIGSGLALLNNSIYSGVTLPTIDTFYLKGGTYSVLFQGRASCAGAATIDLVYTAATATQLLSESQRVNLAAGADTSFIHTGVISVAEGLSIPLTLRGTFTNAASTNVNMHGVVITFVPY